MMLGRYQFTELLLQRGVMAAEAALGEWRNADHFLFLNVKKKECMLYVNFQLKTASSLYKNPKSKAILFGVISGHNLHII